MKEFQDETFKRDILDLIAEKLITHESNDCRKELMTGLFCFRNFKDKNN